MKIEIASNSIRNLISAYDQSEITVNGRIFTQSFIISADEILTPALSHSFGLLQKTDFELLVRKKPEIVILGTGEHQHFLSEQDMEYFYSHGIGIEVMNTYAACRSYNILLSEGRNVVAGLIIEK